MTEKPRIRKITAVSWVICAQTLLLASSGQVALAAGQDTARTANAAATTVTAATTTAKLPGYSDDERTLRQQAVDYAKFYAARDAKSLASMWTTDGTFTDSKGHEYAGRTAIEDYFRDGFSGGSPQTLDVSVTSIKFPAPGVAIEEGTTRIASGPGMGSMGRYLVVHTKVDGNWLMATCAETDYSAKSTFEYLKDLGWLVGTWTVKDQPQAARLKVSWSKNKTFLFCRYIREAANDPEVEEMQIIGWDPQSAEITVWHFGAAGGFGSGRLFCDGKNWIEHASATEPDGTTGRARYKITRVDDNTFTWQSSKRNVAGLALPDSKELTIIREHVQ